jgi:hypothetical protein
MLLGSHSLEVMEGFREQLSQHWCMINDPQTYCLSTASTFHSCSEVCGLSGEVFLQTLSVPSYRLRVRYMPPLCVSLWDLG